MRKMLLTLAFAIALCVTAHEEIDCFRSEMLGENYATAVKRHITENAAERIFSLTGIPQSHLQRGINIIAGSDGKVIKKLLK